MLKSRALARNRFRGKTQCVLFSVSWVDMTENCVTLPELSIGESYVPDNDDE